MRNTKELFNTILNEMNFNDAQSFYIIQNVIKNVEQCGHVTSFNHYTVDVQQGEPRLVINYRNGDNQEVF